ncbi:MAG TPA: membrane protein insertase YidC [Syntrophomonadaceae bacterium]|nr:membrane protein insertase YidC [Syntrophomonadaceae bacterium]
MYLIQYFYEVTVSLKIPSYGLAIIFFTIAVKLVLFPLTLKQMRSMRAMQVLQPKIKALQERYKGQPEKAQREIMNLYKEAGANPFSGCLPLLVQMPVLFALFSALQAFFNPVYLEKSKLHLPPGVDLTHAGFLWISNLGKPDHYVLPILTVLVTFLQQYITSLTTSGKIDQTQRSMLIVMPLFIGWMAYTFPAGLALYWVVFTLVSTVEMLVIKRTVKTEKEKEAKV